MTGRDQGVYEWVAANYAHDTLKSDSADTIGVLSLGSESAQVPHSAPQPNLVSLEQFVYLHELVLMLVLNKLSACFKLLVRA